MNQPKPQAKAVETKSLTKRKKLQIEFFSTYVQLGG